MLKLKTKAKSLMVILLTGTLLLICSSCTIRTKNNFIPPSTPVILRQDVKNVKVWILNEDTGYLMEGVKTIYKNQHVVSFDITKLGVEIKK